MKLWGFNDPRKFEFAEAGSRGSWTAPSGNGVCPECSGSTQARVQPLLVEWLRGPETLGDFTWPGLDAEVVVTDPVFRTLDAHFSGFEAGDVVVQTECGRKSRSQRKLETMAGGDIRLWELWVTTWAHLDKQKSSVELERACRACGRERWEVYGVERWESSYDRDRGQSIRVKRERLPKAGVFVPAAELRSASIFSICELPGWIFCTDDVRLLIERERFTNVAFLEMGDTI